LKFVLLNSSFLFIGKFDGKPLYFSLLTNEQFVTEDFLMRLNSIKKNKNFNPNRSLKKNSITITQPKKKGLLQAFSINEQENQLE
jgi:hypothetical protein